MSIDMQQSKSRRRPQRRKDEDTVVDEKEQEDEEEKEDFFTDLFAPFQQPREPSSSVVEEVVDADVDDSKNGDDALSLSTILFREGVEWMKRRTPNTAALLFARADQWKQQLSPPVVAASPYQPMLHEFQFSSTTGSHAEDVNNYTETDQLLSVIASQPLRSLISQGSSLLNSLIDELRSHHSTTAAPAAPITTTCKPTTMRKAAATSMTAASSPIIVSAGSMFTPVVKTHTFHMEAPSPSRESHKRIRLDS